MRRWTQGAHSTLWMLNRTRRSRAWQRSFLPETDTPGATSTRINEFIDLIVTEWYSEEEKQRFLKGLANVDAVSQKHFGKNFSDCEQTDQTKMMTEWDEAMVAEAASLKAAPTPRMEIADPNENFFFLFKQLTLTGYFTSEAGAKRTLHFQMIPGRYDGCITMTPAEQSK